MSSSCKIGVPPIQMQTIQEEDYKGLFELCLEGEGWERRGLENSHPILGV